MGKNDIGKGKPASKRRKKARRSLQDPDRASVSNTIIDSSLIDDKGPESLNAVPTPSSRRSSSSGRYYAAGEDIDRTLQCWNCGQLGHLSLVCMEKAKETACQLCGLLGHMRRDCPQELCFKCGRPGHRSRECKAAPGTIFRPFISSAKCFKCSRYGHLAAVCAYSAANLDAVEVGLTTQTTTVLAPARVSCYNCGHGGHSGDACTLATVDEWVRTHGGGSGDVSGLARASEQHHHGQRFYKQQQQQRRYSGSSKFERQGDRRYRQPQDDSRRLPYQRDGDSAEHGNGNTFGRRRVVVLPSNRPSSAGGSFGAGGRYSQDSRETTRASSNQSSSGKSKRGRSSDRGRSPASSKGKKRTFRNTEGPPPVSIKNDRSLKRRRRS